MFFGVCEKFIFKNFIADSVAIHYAAKIQKNRVRPYSNFVYLCGLAFIVCKRKISFLECPPHFLKINI